MTNEQRFDRLEDKVDKILTILSKDASSPFRTLKVDLTRFGCCCRIPNLSIQSLYSGYKQPFLQLLTPS